MGHCRIPKKFHFWNGQVCIDLVVIQIKRSLFEFNKPIGILCFFCLPQVEISFFLKWQSCWIHQVPKTDKGASCLPRHIFFSFFIQPYFYLPPTPARHFKPTSNHVLSCTHFQHLIFGPIPHPQGLLSPLLFNSSTM